MVKLLEILRFLVFQHPKWVSLPVYGMDTPGLLSASLNPISSPPISSPPPFPYSLFTSLNSLQVILSNSQTTA